jgi:hypothetical protein
VKSSKSDESECQRAAGEVIEGAFVGLCDQHVLDMGDGVSEGSGEDGGDGEKDRAGENSSSVPSGRRFIFQWQDQ